MEVQGETHWAPKLWDELRRESPEHVCGRALADYNPEGFYQIESLKTLVRVYPSEERIDAGDLDLSFNADYHLLIVYYLLYAQHIDPSGLWVSEKDLGGGSLFFRGPHAMPSAPLEKRFGSDPEGLREKALALGGKSLDFGDVSMAFQVLPRLPLAVVLWTGDEEFPPRATFLLDRSVEAHLKLDVVLSMARSVVVKLIG